MDADSTPGYDLLYDIIRRTIERAQAEAGSDSRGIHRQDPGGGTLGDVGRQLAALGIHRRQRSQGEKGSVSLLFGGQYGFYLLDGAAACLRAAPSGLSDDGRRSGGAPTARRRLVGSAGADRRRRRRPAPVGHGARRAHVWPRSIASHRWFGEHLHVHASGRGFARAGDAMGDDSRPRAVQESSRRAGSA